MSFVDAVETGPLPRVVDRGEAVDGYAGDSIRGRDVVVSAGAGPRRLSWGSAGMDGRSTGRRLDDLGVD